MMAPDAGQGSKSHNVNYDYRILIPIAFREYQLNNLPDNNLKTSGIPE